jgi:pimeloyl-ACP methyl ester carboxylesterase
MVDEVEVDVEHLAARVRDRRGRQATAGQIERHVRPLRLERRERQAHFADHCSHALLLSPWPESLLAFQPAWTRLAEHTHLVAIDLPGFGHSQRRDALLLPRAMGEFLIRVADTFGLENPHVIGPDVGTGASLFAAALHPDRLRSLVVGSGGTAIPLQLGGVLSSPAH